MSIKIIILFLVIGLAYYRIRKTRRLGIGLFDTLGITIKKYSVINIFVGLLIAGVIVCTTFLVEWQFHLLSIDNIEQASVLSYDFTTPILVGFIEELFFRAIVIGCLVLWIRSRLVIVAISAVIFAGVHLQNPNVNVIAFFGYLLGGTIYGICYLRTGYIWLPFGLHLGWNYFQGRVFGFSLSGYQVQNSFISHHNIGPSLWTGGDFGFEGGLLSLIARIFILLLILLWLGTKYSHSNSSPDNLRTLTRT